MSQQHNRWEHTVRVRAHALPYPPTPDIAGVVRRRLAQQATRRGRTIWPRRRMVWVAAALTILLVGMLSVPQVQARILTLLRIGVVRIVLDEPTPAPPVPTTAQPSPTPPARIRDLAGATSLAEARDLVPFPIQTPHYPPQLGEPNYVYVQDLGGPAVILVWLDPEDPSTVRLGLHILSSKAFAEKMLFEATQLEQTTVNGKPAAWVKGSHLLQYRRNNAADYEARQLVDGNVLLWTEGDLTYRLEIDLPLEEAVRIAESLR